MTVPRKKMKECNNKNNKPSTRQPFKDTIHIVLLVTETLVKQKSNRKSMFQRCTLLGKNYAIERGPQTVLKKNHARMKAIETGPCKSSIPQYFVIENIGVWSNFTSLSSTH